MITATIRNFGSERKTSKAGKPYTAHFVTMTDGQVFSTGFGPLVGGFMPGDTISFQAMNKFGKMEIDATTVSKSGGGAAAPGSDYAGKPAAVTTKAYVPAAAKVFPVPKDHGDRSIIRQNSLTNARELYVGLIGVGGTGDWDKAVDQIIAMAYKFEAYSSGDLELNAAKGSRKKNAASVDAAIDADIDAALS